MAAASSILDRAAALAQRYEAISVQLGDPQVIANREAYQRLSKELAGLVSIVQLVRRYQQVTEELTGARHVLETAGDADMRALAEEELIRHAAERHRLMQELEGALLLDGDQADRPIIMEIRPGTGGLEASVFAADLFRMYTKYAASLGLKVETMDSQTTEAGGFKEVIFSMTGKGAWRHFHFESGVHRVQRVPTTEAQGRVHTSTVTVVVLPEPEPVEIEIKPQDLQIDVFRSSGPGGQGVNTTDSAVRIRHVPTGIVVTCQDERSQLRNKDKAMRVLRARLSDLLAQQQQSKRSSDRKSQIGSGDRSEKIRTYNFPDQRVTDHRIGLTIRRLPEILDGNLGAVVEALLAAEKARKLGVPHDRDD